MKFSINQNEFNTSLAVVSKGAATRSTLPILSGILIRARNNTLTLESTNMDQSIRSVCPAFIEEEGDTVISARLLSDIIKSLPDTAIHFSQENETATILCDTSSFSLRTLEPVDFPGFPEVELDNTLSLPFKTFSTMVKRVARVVARDDSHPILSGVLIEAEDKELKMVATDSYRLALEKSPIQEITKPFSAVISGSFLIDLASLSGENEIISLSLSENQIIATYGNYTFVSRKIEGTYPNYKQLIPDSYESCITYKTKQLNDAVKRTSLVSNNTSPIRFDINTPSQTTQLSSTTQDIGAAQETIGSMIEGQDIQIAFNGHYLIEGLGMFNEEELILELQSSVKPGIFKNKDGNYIYLIMPVRLV